MHFWIEFIVRFLALETSTQQMSVGVAQATAQGDWRQWVQTATGGAQASHALLPTIQALLQEAGMSLPDLNALVLGRGPGAFTGLRTACAVAQGLAYGVRTAVHPQGLPVLAVDTLLAVAEEARASLAAARQQGRLSVTAVLDARMGELYAATYCFDDAAVSQARLLNGPDLLAPEQLAAHAAEVSAALPTPISIPVPHLWAGNVWDDAALVERMAWDEATVAACVCAWPTAQALLRLAPALWQSGQAVPAAQAQPLYVRDKVAQTTAERAMAASSQGASHAAA
jgi:tRNA threonylcarbamoyladenosine biosynthesis protein TsaB